MAIRGSFSCVQVLLMMLIGDAKAEILTSWRDLSEISTVTMATVLCVSVLVVVFVISLCGGCTPMEVGSDEHAASGGSKSYSQYSSVATDVNTHVMSSGTTLPNDPYQPPSQFLPYPLHPETAQNFTGYQSQGQQQSGAGSQGFNSNNAQGYQAAGAHRHFSESEPPPPDYFEAVQSGTPARGQGQSGSQATAPAQQYGW